MYSSWHIAVWPTTTINKKRRSQRTEDTEDTFGASVLAFGAVSVHVAVQLLGVRDKNEGGKKTKKKRNQKFNKNKK